MSASLSFELCGGGRGWGGTGGVSGFNFSSFQTRVTNGKRNTDAARVSSQGWMLCCSAVTHHLPICRLCLTCDPPPPHTPSGIGARHLSPQVSFILRRFGSPLVTDEQKKNDRQMNKGADAVWGPRDRESEGDANYSLSGALLRSYLSASHLTLNAAFRARVVSAVTDGNTSGKSSVVAVGPLNPLTGYKDGQRIRFQKGGRRAKKNQNKKTCILSFDQQGSPKTVA